MPLKSGPPRECTSEARCGVAIGHEGDKRRAHRASLWAPPQPGAPSLPIAADH